MINFVNIKKILNKGRSMKPIYKRILLKLSGEGLMGSKEFGMDAAVINSLAEQIKHIRDAGVEGCIVVGG